MTKEEEVLKRLDKEINPYSLSVLKSYAKETAIEFLLANLDSEPITDRDIIIFYQNVYDEWYTKHKEG